MATIEAVVEPQAVVTVAGADAEEARLAVDVVVVDTRVRERLEADRLARRRGRRVVAVAESRACRAGDRGDARQVRRVGGGWWRERGKG